ncbi:hypothetical protein C2869_04350 [Saccharobesus litoralis]|uniref:F5/8 type C domain-containing protein n=1 Tax=Saccharobesus litoralis TaxID=2172099 RepID=A0A2S0VNC1_9ALTE|nr:discoidin domain-containing protein [Saccharobesus litoralis]AWB65717.1 hypothetical protein C2869_04350 [Saccharobesus litoralis]
MLTKQSFLLSSILLALGFSSANAAEPVNITASSHDGNVPENTADNDLATRWSANGAGEYIEYDLGDSFSVDSIDIAFYKGDQRSATFDVLTSEDASNWTTVFSGVQAESTTALQNIALTSSDAQFVRIVGYGNSANSWNSITEVDINTSAIDNGGDGNGENGGTGQIVATASSDDGNIADNVLDGDLNTRWSSLGHGEWLELDLGVSQQVGTVSIAFFKGDQRSANFDIETSDDGNSWTTSLAGATSNGSSTNLEDFAIPTTDARYVRFVGFGNSANNWNSITEMAVSPDGGTDGNGDDGGNGNGDGNGDGNGNDGGATGGDVDPVTGATLNATVDNFSDVLATASAGDEIVVTGSGELTISNYDFSYPVLVRAASLGSVTLTNATIKNTNNVTLHGFVFGPSTESTLLKIVNSTNIKVLRNSFDHKDVANSQSSIVTTQASDSISIGYNEFKNKNIDDVNGSKITGSFIKTQFDDPLMTKNLHVYRNHFNFIAPFETGGAPAGDSDREAIAMGIADSQDVITNNIVEYNLFENCDGENEIITVKTSNNTFRHNTFKNSMGSLSFRLGSNNKAYGNYFYGVGASVEVSDENYQTGGIRVYGSGHEIYDNYMEGLSGISWRRPILIDSGDTSDSTGNDSHEVSSNIQVYNNTIVDSVGGGIHLGGDRYNKMPFNITVDGNTVVSSQGILFNNVADDASNIWSNNQAYATGDAIAVDGGALSSSQVQVLSSQPTINKPTPLTASDVGPNAPYVE